MMFIKDSVRNQDLTWHVGQVKPDVLGTVLSIQVDGDELEHVRMLFPHITPNCRVAIFTHDLAQLVYDNLGRL